MKIKVTITALVCAMFLLTACAAPAEVSEPAAAGTQQPAATTAEEAAEPAAPTPVPTAPVEFSDPPFGEFTALDLDGNEVTQEIFADSRLTLVNVWGTYCSPCLREMPVLQELSEKYADRGMKVVGIVKDGVDDQGEEMPGQVELVREIQERTGATYQHILPSKELIDGALSQVIAVPESFFVDSEGNQVGRVYGGTRPIEYWDEIIEGLYAALDARDAGR